MRKTVQEIASLVVTDLVNTAMPVPILREVDMDSSEYVKVDIVSASGSGSNVYLSCLLAESVQVVELADAIQEWVIDEIRSDQPTNWPPCDLHPHSHPLKPADIEVLGAVWTCPMSDELKIPIGRLTKRL